MPDLWKRYHQLALLSSGFLQISDNASGTGAADYAVIYDNDVPSLYNWLDHYDSAHDLFTAFMSWLYETAKTAFASITILHQSLLHWDTAYLRIAKRGRPGRVWDRYDDICFEWILLGEYAS